MYEKFPYHNIMHNILTNLFRVVWTNKDYPLFEEAMFSKEGSIIKALEHAESNCMKEVSLGDKVRKWSLGYKPHLVELTNMLLNSSKNSVLDQIEASKKGLTIRQELACIPNESHGRGR